MSAGSNETWLAIEGHPNYLVSDLGRVRSLPRPRSRGGILRTSLRNGYPSVMLYGNGRRSSQLVHHLVAYTFLGPRPEGMQVRHLDGDKLNPSADNLAYGSQSDNELDKVRHGRNINAAKTHCPRGHNYSDPDVLVVFESHRMCRPCRVADRAERAKREAAPAACPDCGSMVRSNNLNRHRQRNCARIRAALDGAS